MKNSGPKFDLAPDGAVWVCGACGKTSNDRYGFNDVSCFLNSVLCEENTLVYDGGRVCHAETWAKPLG